MRLLIMTLLALTLLACSPPPPPSPTSPPPMSERQRETARATQEFEYGNLFVSRLLETIYLYHRQCSRVRDLKDDVINTYENAIAELATLVDPSWNREYVAKGYEERLRVQAVIDIADDAIKMMYDRCLP